MQASVSFTRSLTLQKTNLFSLEEYKNLHVRDRTHADLIEAATFQTITFIHDKWVHVDVGD